MSASASSNSTSPTASVIGWREWIALPELGLTKLRAKIDTGARTAALYATEIDYQTVDGVEMVNFILPFDENRRITLPVHGQRKVRNTSGVPEVRTIIRTGMVLGAQGWDIDIALSNRENMLNPIILGRTSVRGRKLMINPGRSFLKDLPVINGDGI